MVPSGSYTDYCGEEWLTIPYGPVGLTTVRTVIVRGIELAARAVCERDTRTSTYRKFTTA